MNIIYANRFMIMRLWDGALQTGCGALGWLHINRYLTVRTDTHQPMAVAAARHRARSRLPAGVARWLLPPPTSAEARKSSHVTSLGYNSSSLLCLLSYQVIAQML